MDALIAAHSGLRWLVLLGVAAVVGIATTYEWTRLPAWVRVVGAVFTLQVVLGLVLYAANQGWDQGPFLAYWHPVAMIAALGLFQVGTARFGRGEIPTRALTLFTGASLLLMVAAIPWWRGMV